MKRIRSTEGQLALPFNLLEPDPVPVVMVAEEPVTVEPAPVNITTVKKPAKLRVKKIVPFAGPSVTLHKAGRRIIFRANDPIAADIWREVRERAESQCFREPGYYTGDFRSRSASKDEILSIDIWRQLDQDITCHPFAEILRSMGVEVTISDTLRNFMRKESKRQELENTPLPWTKIETDVKLFDRCSEGTVLRCIKDYSVYAGVNKDFKQGQRYVVLSAGAEGKEIVTISTEPVTDRMNVSSKDSKKLLDWTTFSPDLEEYFSDSEEYDLGQSIPEKYPERVAEARKKLEKLNLPLFDHVKEDVILMSLLRGGICGYLMRMGKTSFAITWALMRGNRTWALIGPRNARIFTVKEFQRMGFTENKDFVVVDKLADLDKPAKFYLMTYTWLRYQYDPSYEERRSWENFLRPSVRLTKKKGSSEEIEQGMCNICPHCERNLFRLVPVPPDRTTELGSELGVEQTIRISQNGRPSYWKWSSVRGYRCINPDCDYKVIPEGKKRTRLTGGYVDYNLAAHANCEDKQPKGRLCKTCRQADGVWIPPVYKRMKKRFKGVIRDEAHSCKDDSTQTAKASINLGGRSRLDLTGTLISNGPTDAYAPLHYVMRAPHSGFPYFRKEGAKQFTTRFCESVILEKPIGEETDLKTGKKIQLTKTVKKQVPFLKNPPEFWRFMAPKMVRRVYEDPVYQQTLLANNRHTPKTEIIRYACEMDPIQAKIMLASIKDFKGQFEKMMEEAKKKGQNLNSALVISQMATLRMLATCPEMLNERFGTEVYKGTHGGGKIKPIMDLVADEVDNKRGKVLILSDFHKMQETCVNALKAYNPIRFNTSWDDDERREAFEAFSYGTGPEDPYVFVAGTRAVREGVDLSAEGKCNLTICTDLLWSPAFQTQAWSRSLTPSTMERFARIFLMVSKNSLDEHIYGVFYSKMVAAAQAMDKKISRRTQEFDVRWFVERVLEEESSITSYLERLEDDEGGTTMIIPELDEMALMEREI